MGYSSLRCLGFSLRWLLLLLSMGSRVCRLQSLMCVLRSCSLKALDMGLVVVAHGPRCSETHRIFQDQELNSCPLFWPWRREWQSTPVFLLGESHVLRSLAVYRSWGCKELELAEWLSTLALVGRLLTTGSSRKPPKVRVLTLKSQRIVVSRGWEQRQKGRQRSKEKPPYVRAPKQIWTSAKFHLHYCLSAILFTWELNLWGRKWSPRPIPPPS